MGQVKVLSLTTGVQVLMDETLAQNYYRLDGRYVVGSPVNDATAPRQSIWSNILAPPAPINWRSMPSIPDGSTDYVLAPGNYLNEDPSRSLLTGKYTGRRIIIQGTPGNPMRLRSAGAILDGYRCRWLITNTWLESMNPGVFGQSPGRALQGDEILWLEMYNNLFDGTTGIVLTGKAAPDGSYLNQWMGNAAAGERVRIERNRVRNIRGQMSDGTRDPADPMRVIPIRSNWGTNHAGNPARWNPAVPLAERTDANKADPAKYGQLGWNAVNFIIVRSLPGLVDSRIAHNEIINAYGEARQEDNLNFYDGSGGTAASPFVVTGNYVYGGQGFDWNYRRGQGMTYDGSNRITLGATSYQDVSQTFYSGSGAVNDTPYPSTLPGSWERNGYVLWQDHTVVGTYASHQGGHDVTFDGVRVYESVTTQDGDPLANPRAGWQMTDYPKKYNQPRTAVTAGGVTRDCWGNVAMRNCSLYAGTTAGGSLLDPDSMRDLLYNGGTYDTPTNIKYARPANGFEAQLLADWRANKAAAGLSIGLTG